MKIILILCCGYVALSAGAGYLFGQAFFGDFDLIATFAGITGLGAGILGIAFFAESKGRSMQLIALSIAALFGVGLDAYQYYRHYDIPGNYYAWGLIGPYCVCLLIIMLRAAQIEASNNRRQRDA